MTAPNTPGLYRDAVLHAAALLRDDPLLAAFWQKLCDLGEMVDMWRLRESEVGHG